MKMRHYFVECAEGNPKRIKNNYRCLAMTIILFVLLFSRTLGNNLQVGNLSVDQPNQNVTFNLGWDNSWRNTTAPPNNWDAAWVFVKFRDCTAGNAVQFTHGLVNTSVSSHVFAGGTLLEPTARDGTGNSIDASPNNTGVMLRRAVDATTGSVGASITLKITNMPTTGTIDVRVYALEMVFIPQGSFVLGDGNGTNISYGGFASADNGLTSNAIANENSITVYRGSGASTATASLCYSGGCTLASSYPKGFNPFYIMKYEISQGQYADFLNGAFAVAQSNHFANQSGNARNTVTNTGNPPAQYAAGRSDRACNYLSWSDVGTYLEWAALRPLTELEYEKACRGSLAAVPFEGAWGTITGVAPTAAGISGTENGTETITTANANVSAGNITYSSGDNGAGPLRAGIFAQPSSNSRLQTGASYYGVMELSGNVVEFYISAYAGVSGVGGPSASGVTDGDGQVDNTTGNFNNTSWPSATSAGFVIRRGGSYTVTGLTGSSTTAERLNVSDRYQVGTYNDQSRTAVTGGRGGR